MRVQGTHRYCPDHRCNIDPNHSPCGSNFHHTAGPQVIGLSVHRYALQRHALFCNLLLPSPVILEGWSDSLDCQIPKQWDGMRGIEEWIVDLMFIGTCII